MLLAGIWDRWRKGNEVLESFAVVTTAVHDRLSFVHRRQPVMLSRAEGRRWVDRTEDQTTLKDELLRSRLPVALSVVPVSTYVNTSRNEGDAVHRTHRPYDRTRRGGVVVRRVWRIFAGIVLTTLFGCGDGSVNACFGDAAFCHFAFNPVARPGPDQTVASGDVVTLDGSNSTPSGGIRSYSWTQTGGPAVTLTDANKARATFVAPSVTSGADPVVPADGSESTRTRPTPIPRR